MIIGRVTAADNRLFVEAVLYRYRIGFSDVEPTAVPGRVGHSSRSTSRRASAAGKDSYRDAGFWVLRLSCISSPLERVCRTAPAWRDAAGSIVLTRERPPRSPHHHETVLI